MSKPTDFFNYQNDQLTCEGVPLADLAKAYGTPLYVYSLKALTDQFDRFDGSFKDVDHVICYSMKANSTQAVLKAFIKRGCGIDVVTQGELLRARNAGCDASKIVFAGVGKDNDEIALALKEGILQFNVESEEELDNINAVASTLGKTAPIALRVNPDVDPKTHAYISTGLKKSKFGVNHKTAVDLYKKAATLKNLEIVGIDCHIGSQLTTLDPFVAALERVKQLIGDLAKAGIKLKHLDIGGGLGITYRDETPPEPEAYAKAILSVVKDLGLKLILEPGRFLVGNAGTLLTRVLYNKSGEEKKFIIVDAASNNLMRPALYGAYHEILPLKKDSSRTLQTADVVGPICETGDFLATDRELPQVSRGEYLAILSAGAYGFSMSSTYNSRPRCAEAMVSGNQHEIVRTAETLEDVTRGEKVPSFL